MTLYLNLIYFPCWLAVIIIIDIVFAINFTIHVMMIIRIIQVILMVAMVKFSLLNYLYKFVLVTILVAVIIIEVFSSCQTLLLTEVSSYKVSSSLYIYCHQPPIPLFAFTS